MVILTDILDVPVWYHRLNEVVQTIFSIGGADNIDDHHEYDHQNRLRLFYGCDPLYTQKRTLALIMSQAFQDVKKLQQT